MKNLRINKRLFASILSFTMITTSLVGCSSEPFERFSYETLEDGTVECIGRINYELLKKYEVVELTIFDKKELYVVQKSGTSRYYFNIENSLRIYNIDNDDSNKKITSLGKVEDYLLYYDMVKESYSIEDVENLLFMIKEDRELKEDKTLVKE